MIFYTYKMDRLQEEAGDINLHPMIFENGNHTLSSYNDAKTKMSMHHKNMGEKNKMTSIKEQAESYEPKQTKNISDLDRVSVDVSIREETFTKSDGEEFTINLTEVDGEQYRVPVSVLKSLKAVLSEKPDMKFFKVKKSGDGMNTSYTVIPIEE